jgi:outer membrane cobalamin receptor
LLCSFLGHSQGTIQGNIRGENNGGILAGAHIIVTGTANGSIADNHGNFMLKNITPGQHVLEISFVGYERLYQPVEVADKSITKIAVRMNPGDIQLADVTVTATAEKSINTLSPLDIKLRPTNTSQDILRMVPGLFIAQHAGGGKAEQIFLRGFDVDHGTDVNLEVDGLPVNMVSHAHGQGYSDLHFIIPEIVNYVDFNKGPYYADKGDFTTAGYVDFQTKNSLDNNFFKLEGGQFGTARGVVGVNIVSPGNTTTQGYIASEFFMTDGFVESPQDFNRFNVTSKVSSRIGKNDQISLGLSFFTSRWDASGQIPTRAVDNGSITRFGSIDNTEGGKTSRTNINIKHQHQFENGSYLNQQLYGIHYDFNLFSNFTFFLNDPVNGDQIQQTEGRMIYGYKTTYNNGGSIFGKVFKTEAGAGFRLDDVNNIALSRSVKREFLSDVKRGDVFEANYNAFINESLLLNEKWSLNAAARIDYFRFRYADKIDGQTGSASKIIVSPKFTVNYQASSNVHLYLRSGLGFHSNDARVIIEQDGENILPRAYGIDLGMNSKITDRLLINLALWKLDLQEEFVYVGDEGIVEPSGKTQREGIDLSLRYEILPWLFVDGDVNITKPRAKGEEEGMNYIPLAPDVSSIGGLSFRMKNGVNGSLRYRYLDDRPANENNSIIADGYFLADAVVNYTRSKFEIGLSVENIFNIEWNEAQFDTESRLQNEQGSVSEIHFTPGTPFFAKLKLCLFF